MEFLTSDFLKKNRESFFNQTEHNWFVLNVRSKYELKTAIDLYCKNNTFYIPLTISERSGKIKPLWPNYIFIDLNNFSFPMYSRTIKHLIEIRNQSNFVDSLKNISDVLNSTEKIIYHKNDMVEIIFGKDKGQRGRIESIIFDNNDISYNIKLTVGRQSVCCISDIKLVSNQFDEINSDTKSVICNYINNEIVGYYKRNPFKLYEMPSHRFEILVGDILTGMGYEVKLTPQTRDGGRDLLAVLNTPLGKLLTIVECKRYSPENKIGIDIVERLLWVTEHKDRASSALIATTSSFSPDAIKMAKEFDWKLKLKDYEDITGWLHSYGNWNKNNFAGLWVPDFKKK